MMARSRLIIRGYFSSAQFYPQGNSDADTMNVTIATASFVDATGKETSVYGKLIKAHYEDAAAPGGPTKKPVVKGGGIRVRLQGIDAPELHFQAGETFYRQPRGAYAARRLNEALRFHGGGDDMLACEITTNVDRPSDAFDKFGRLIGNVLLGSGPEKRDLNLQLLRDGLAFATIYDSMAADEITAVLEAERTGRTAQNAIWKEWTQQLTFDPALLAPAPHEEVDAEQPDRGPIILPKLFRRLSSHLTGGRPLDTFKAALAEGGEKVFRTEEFLAGTPTPVPFADFVDATDPSAPRFSVEPGALVFLEAPGQIWIETSPGVFDVWA